MRLGQLPSSITGFHTKVLIIKYLMKFSLRKKIDFNKLKVFGCQVFYYVPKQFRKKFDNSSSPGIFIGYDQNPTAYRIYDPNQNMIILSRSVEFFENIPVKFVIPSSPPEIFNFIPYYGKGGNVHYYHYFGN